MAKMRVHELAKELNIKSQEIVEILSTTEFAVTSASSGIEDAAQEIVRSKFKPKPQKKEEKKPEKKEVKLKKEKKKKEKQPQKIEIEFIGQEEFEREREAEKARKKEWETSQRKGKKSRI